MSLVCGAWAAAQPCEKAATVGGVTVFRVNRALTYSSGLQIDADGAPNAYGPDGKGLDHLANAGKPGNWWGVATQDGAPVVQSASDPFPGFYVSTTALEDRRFKAGDPRRYVDSSRVPYVVLPPQLLKEAKLGDFAVVINEQNGRVAFALVADVGPRDKLGEGSMALAAALGIDSDPKRGGTRAKIRYVIFPGSGSGRPRTSDEISAEGSRLQRGVPATACE
jgi:hypothetical protein